MVFTLAQQLKELIADMMKRRKERIAREDEERYRREEEVRTSLSPSQLVFITACADPLPRPPVRRHRHKTPRSAARP